MNIFEEPIYYQNPALQIKVAEFRTEIVLETAPPIQQASWHHHKEVEFIWVRQGTHEVHTPDHTYILNAGDVVLIGASQLHRARPRTADLVYIVLHVVLQPYFDPPMMMYYQHFSEVRYPLESLNYIFRENEAVREEVGRIIVKMHEEITGRVRGYEIAASMHVKQLLLALLRGDSRELLRSHDIVDAAVMNPILAYVDEHLGDKLDMEQVSRMANMSYFYFSRFFKKTTGLSFTEYVAKRRIAKAEQLLVTSALSIGEIAARVGMENMAHFYRLFKRVNQCTPKQFLQKMGR